MNSLSSVSVQELPANLSVRNELPIAIFPEDVKRFWQQEAPGVWESLDEDDQRFLATIGTKIEPIVQIIPRMPSPPIIGFENLALGALGENFSQICSRFPQLDPGLLRFQVTLVALKTNEMLRVNAERKGDDGAWRLLFSINLDPQMLDSECLYNFLDKNWHYWAHNILWEVNEGTTSEYLRKLKELQVDRNMRFSADDYNNWNTDVKRAMKDRVEMSKVDYKTFREAMDLRGEEPDEAIQIIAAHRIGNKPLIVEGVEDPNYLRFLREHWPLKKYGQLFGQGYIIEPGRPWDVWTADLRQFGLQGGHFVVSPPKTAEHATV